MKDNKDYDENDVIPIIRITDPYGYVSSNKAIATLVILDKNGMEHCRHVIRTKNQKYMAQ